MRNVIARLGDLEVGDTIVVSGNTFVYASHTTSLNGFVMLADVGGRILVFAPGSTVTIQIA